MSSLKDTYLRIKTEITNLSSDKCQLLVVSKTRTPEEIKMLYDLGQRDFGENMVQELAKKQAVLPNDIRWHMVGHLQSNKVKYIAPFIHLIHSIDNLKVLKEIEKHAMKNKRKIACLLQINISKEVSKFGIEQENIFGFIKHLKEENLQNINIKGLMGMGSNTDNQTVVSNEFVWIKKLFDQIKDRALFGNTFHELSIGMTSDYRLAIANGSSIVRIGTKIFGERRYKR